MEDGPLLVLIAAMAIVTYSVRLSLVFFTRRYKPFPRLAALILSEVPLAAYASIIVSTVAVPGGDVDLDVSNLYLYAAGAAIVVSARTANILAVVAVAVGVAALLHVLV